jgi:hypothetical protein
MNAQGRHEERVLLSEYLTPTPFGKSLLIMAASSLRAVLPPTRTLSSRKYYKPWVLRSPSLLFLLAITLTLIGLVEYAFHVLPRAGSNGTIEAIEGSISGFSYNRKRQDDGGYWSTVTTLYVAIILEAFVPSLSCIYV